MDDIALELPVRPGTAAQLGQIPERCRATWDAGATVAHALCSLYRYRCPLCDGSTCTTPSNSIDHARDRLFRAHGIRVVEHVDAGEGRERPDAVVRQFPDILRHA